MLEIVLSSLTQGVVWSMMAIGVYITFRLLDIADLSAEGTFPLGAAICASLIVRDVNPWLATGAAFMGGALAGSVGGWLHTKLRIPALLTGILVLTALYSINLRVMSGKANIALLGKNTIFSNLQEALQVSKNTSVLLVSMGMVIVVIVLLVSFMNTEIGLGLRATGDNEAMASANGINTNRMKIRGYWIGNGLIALAGAMVAQKDGFADIGMGIGTIVIGLASIIICEVILPHKRLGIRLGTIILGSFLYRLIIDTILNQTVIAIQSTDLRLFSAILLALVLYMPELQKHNFLGKKVEKGGK